MTKVKLTFLFLLCCFGLQAQEVLTKEAAVSVALENNYGVKIAENAVAVKIVLVFLILGFYQHLQVMQEQIII